MTKLPLEEQETVLSMAGDDRATWHVYSDDKIQQARLEAVGAVLVRKARKGPGKFYTLRDDQVLFRKGKPQRGPVSEAQKVALQDGQFTPFSQDGIQDSDTLHGLLVVDDLEVRLAVQMGVRNG